jgi:hypothetical protein
MTSIYDPNPLAEAIRNTNPLRYDRVIAIKTPPKMFAGGAADHPAFTASGIDPEQLLKLPYGVRHAAAAEPDITKVYALFEQYAEGVMLLSSDPVINHPGLDDARARLKDWLEHTDLDTRTPEQREADADAEYAQYFRVDNDRASYAAEQKRREKAGEEPLEDFAVLNERYKRAQQWAANNGGGSR